MARIPTASQTLGPFFSYGFLREDDAQIAGPKAAGEAAILCGKLIDRSGSPIRDGLVEVWQADAEGRYPGADPVADPNVRGHGRCLTDADGRFRFETIIPGAVSAGGNSLQAPHFAIGIVASGLMSRLTTRIYAPDNGANIADSFFDALPEQTQTQLRAVNAGAEDGRTILELDIRLGGDNATPVFDD